MSTLHISSHMPAASAIDGRDAEGSFLPYVSGLVVAGQNSLKRCSKPTFRNGHLPMEDANDLGSKDDRSSLDTPGGGG